MLTESSYLMAHSVRSLVFLQRTQWDCRFQNVSLLAMPLIMQLEQTLLALPRC